MFVNAAEHPPEERSDGKMAKARTLAGDDFQPIFIFMVCACDIPDLTPTCQVSFYVLCSLGDLSRDADHRRPASAEFLYWCCVNSCCGTYAIRKSWLVRVATTLHNLKAPYTLSAPGSQMRPTTKKKVQCLLLPQTRRAPTVWNLGRCIEQ